jgi:hypothetical protein
MDLKENGQEEEEPNTKTVQRTAFTHSRRTPGKTQPDPKRFTSSPEKLSNTGQKRRKDI